MSFMLKKEQQLLKKQYLKIKRDIDNPHINNFEWEAELNEISHYANGIIIALKNTTIGEYKDREKLILGAESLIAQNRLEYEITIQKRKAASKMETNNHESVSNFEKEIIVSTKDEIENIIKRAKKSSNLKEVNSRGYIFKKNINAEIELISQFIKKHKKNFNSRYPQKMSNELLRELIKYQERLNDLIEINKTVSEKEVQTMMGL